jgi:hypothetical protein
MLPSGMAGRIYAILFSRDLSGGLHGGMHLDHHWNHWS